MVCVGVVSVSWCGCGECVVCVGVACSPCVFHVSSFAGYFLVLKKALRMSLFLVGPVSERTFLWGT